MAYNTDNRKEPSRGYMPEKSSSAMWLIAGVVIVLAIIGLMVWGGSSTPVSTTTAPSVENNATVTPSTPTTPAPADTTKMDAQPPADAPATTTVTPAPAETPTAPATTPAPAFADLERSE